MTSKAITEMEVFKKRINTLTKTIVILFIVSLIYFLHKRNFNYQLEQYKVVNELSHFVSTAPQIDDNILNLYYHFNRPSQTTSSDSIKAVIFKIFKKMGFEEINNFEIKNAINESGNYIFISDNGELSKLNNSTFGLQKGTNTTNSIISWYFSFNDTVKLSVCAKVDSAEILKSLSKTFYGFYQTLLERVQSGSINGDTIVFKDGRKCSNVDAAAIKETESILGNLVRKGTVDSTFYKCRFDILNWRLTKMSQSYNGELYLGIEGRLWLPYFIGIPAQVVNTTTTPQKILTTCSVLNFPIPLSDAKWVAIDNQRLREIQNYYGLLAINKVQELIEEDYLKIYKNINVLGFEISTRDFPYVLQLLSSVLLLSLFFGIRGIVKKRVPFFSTDYDDDVFEYYVNLKVLRFSCWVILPLIISIACLPIQALSLGMIFVFSIWGLANTMFGLAAFWLSARKN